MKTNRSILMALASVWLSCCVIAEETRKNGSNVEESFFEAVQNDNVEEMRTMLSKRADLISIKNADGRTPLHIAALYGIRETAKLLVAAKADINANTKEGETPLFCAVANGDREIVSLLLANGANVKSPSNDGATPLHAAAIAGSLEAAKILIENKAAVNAKDARKLTPLHGAAMQGQKDVVMLLLEKQADVDAKAEGDFTPLHLAVYGGTKDTVAALLANKASVNVMDDRYRTPLRVALTDGKKKEIANLLVQHGAREENKFYQLAAKHSLVVQVAEGFKEVPVMEGWNDRYGYAISNAKLGCEVRMRIDKVDTSPLKPGEIRADMNKVYPMMLFMLTQEITGEKQENLHTLGSEDALKNHNADGVAVAYSEIKSNIKKDPKSFARGFGYCITIAIHRDNVADGYIIYLYKDKAAYEKALENQSWMGNGLKFQAKGGTQDNPPSTTLPGPDRKTSSKRVISERLITPINPSWLAGTLTISADNRRMACIGGEGDRQFVVVDGIEGKRYEYIGENSLIFSSDGGRLAYTAMTNGRWRVVLDGVPGNPYDAICGPALVFSPDGKGLAYQAKATNGWVTVLNGREGKPYASFGALAISPDGKSVASVVLQGNKQFVVQDNKAEKAYEGVVNRSLVFSPDSKRIAYYAQDGDNSFVVFDGTEGRRHDGFYKNTKPRFDSATAIHYLAGKGKEIYLVEEKIEP